MAKSDYYTYEVNVPTTNADTIAGLRNHINMVCNLINNLHIVLSPEQAQRLGGYYEGLNIDEMDVITLKSHK
jgi:hypothetical protein